MIADQNVETSCFLIYFKGNLLLFFLSIKKFDSKYENPFIKELAWSDLSILQISVTVEFLPALIKKI